MDPADEPDPETVEPEAAADFAADLLRLVVLDIQSLTPGAFALGAAGVVAAICRDRGWDAEHVARNIHHLLTEA